MNIINLFVIVVSIAIADSSKSDDRHARRKRSVGNLCNLLQHKTGKNCLHFLNYGNFCGLGGSGVPLDEIDYCCFIHDRCFDQATYSCQSSKLTMLMMPYHWRFIQPRGKVMCSQTQHPCSIHKCECDREFARCTAIALGTLHPVMMPALHFEVDDDDHYYFFK